MTKHGATWTPRDHRKHAKKMARKGSLGFKPVPNAAAQTTVQWMRDCGTKSKNKNVPDGTYTYKLEYQEAAGEPLRFATGHLNVLR